MHASFLNLHEYTSDGLIKIFHSERTWILMLSPDESLISKIVKTSSPFLATFDRATKCRIRKFAFRDQEKNQGRKGNPSSAVCRNMHGRKTIHVKFGGFFLQTQMKDKISSICGSSGRIICLHFARNSRRLRGTPVFQALSGW